MRTRHTALPLMVPCFFGAALLLAGCSPQDDALGEQGHADGGNDANVSDLGKVTCEEDGQTYQVGDNITLNACTTCVCQPDGTVGLCTGLCSPDAAAQVDAAVTCTHNGTTYQIGETVVLSACTSCICQADGKVGLCTGLCPPDAATDAAVTCTQNGTTYQVGETVVLDPCTSCVCQKDGSLGLCTGLCLPDAATESDAPVTCTQNGTTYQVGDIIRYNACTSCVCQKDGTLGMCTGDCPPDAAADAAGTCTLDGKTYPVGARVSGSGCVSCACQADGTWGMCTGSCPPVDGPTPLDADTSPAGLCTRSHGQVATSQCCQSTGDFPDTCLVGACGCSPSNSHTVSTCSCPAGTCFDPTRGCVGVPNVCTPGQDQTCNADAASSALLGFCGDDGSCLCIAGTTREASGKCHKP